MAQTTSTLGQAAQRYSREAAKRTEVRGDVLPMLASCRDLAAELLSTSLTAMLDKIEDSLFKLADTATDRNQQNLYLQARGEAQAKRLAITTEFRRQFVTGFNRMVGGEANTLKGADDANRGSGELSLLGDSEFEEGLAASKIEAQLKSAGGDELLALNQRIAMLMAQHAPSAQADCNPISPQAIAEAFRAACQQIESDLNVRLLVLKQFEQVAGEQVSDVYQGLNTFLIQRNILPVLPKAAIRRSRPAPSASAITARQHDFGRAEAVNADHHNGHTSPIHASQAELAGYAAAREHELLASVRQWLALNPWHNGSAAVSEHSAKELGAESMGSALGQSFLDALSSLQQGKLNPAMQDVGDLDVAALLSGQANILHQLKTTSLGRELGHWEAMTVDVVAMLFDHLFADKALQPAMQALIGRLQIPVLKVAMLDSKFFARKNHPAPQPYNPSPRSTHHVPCPNMEMPTYTFLLHL